MSFRFLVSSFWFVATLIIAHCLTLSVMAQNKSCELTLRKTKTGAQASPLAMSAKRENNRLPVVPESITSNFRVEATLIASGDACAPVLQNISCEFDAQTLQFVGKPTEQARCLLRPNKIGGVLGEQLKTLPSPLEKLIGEKVKVRKESLRKFLSRNKINETDIGGSLDENLSTATLPNGEKIQALYFVIHDTSSPYLKDAPFPPNFDTDENWHGNDLSVWLRQPVAHIFVNRLGASITTTTFNESVKKGWGTKFARDFLKADGKGLQIHIELIQPRRRDIKNPNPENDLFAPFPGFTDKQYERLAVLYIAASVRRGTWLIPAYHSAIDAGIKDAHDDPQNFLLEKFSEALKKLLKNVG